MGRMSSLLVGGLIGAGVAMYLQSERGADARKRLVNLRDQYMDQYGDVIEQGKIRATELINTGKETLDTTLAQGQDLVNTAVEKARTTMDQGQGEGEAKPQEQQASAKQF